MKILPKYMDWIGVVGNKNTTPALSVVSKWLPNASTEGREGKGLSSDEVLHQLFSANNGNASQKLFNGDTSGHNNDSSSADLALVNYIAFYTQDSEQIDELFRQSELMREKWGEPHSSTGETYGEMTINKAIRGLSNTYSAPITQKHSLPAFKFISGNQLLQLPMKTDWLIEGYIPSDATVMLFGSPASGKSLIALEMGCCIASGYSWHGQSVKKGAVAYIAGEGFSGLSKRLNALVMDKGLTIDDHFHSSEIAMDLFNADSTNTVLEAVQNIQDLQLIIIDTLHRNFTGDENLSSNFATGLKHCDMLRFATGATIMLVHHSGHKSADRGRGSSSMTGAMDAEFKVSKSKNLVTLHCTKMKDDEEPADKGFELQPLTIGIDDSGSEITAPILKQRTTSTNFGLATSMSKTEKLIFSVLTNLSTSTNASVTKEGWRSACIDKMSVMDGSVDPQGSKLRQFSRSVVKLLVASKVSEKGGCFIVAEAQASTEERGDA